MGELMFYILVILAAFFAMPASAQSVKDQLVGAWRYVSCSYDPAECAKPNGILIFTANGHYALINAAMGRTKVSGRPLYTSPAEEIKAVERAFRANFGTWTYNEVDKGLTFHIEGAFFPNLEGNNIKGTITVTGDELKFQNPDGEAVLRRVSK
jgi:hypothetical protein